MRYLLPTLLLALPAFADEPPRFAERTPPAKYPPAHTAERAGTTTSFNRFAILTPAPGTAGGNINGVYGTDSVGAPRRYFRIFIGPTTRGGSVTDNYSTSAAHLPDIAGNRPLRNAIVGSREAAGK